jgi:PAP2 superfamily
MRLKFLSLGILFIGLWLAKPTQAQDSTAHPKTHSVLWNEVALQAIRNTRFAPPYTARALAIVNTSMFDAWAAYDRQAVGTQLANTLQLPQSENTLKNKNEAVSYAAYRTLVDLFPSQTSLFDNLMLNLGYNPGNTSTNVSTPNGIGNYVAQLLLTVRHHDGSNQLGNLSAAGVPYADYTGYAPVNTATILNDPGRWQPLLVPNGQGGMIEQTFLAPHWNRVTPFALKNSSQLRPNPPAAVDTVKYRQQANVIYQMSLNLTDQQKVIASYWADGPATETPPGHWNLFAQTISVRDGHTLDHDIKLFFALSNGLLDASIAAWDAKVTYDSVRPITAIRHLIDPAWNTYIPTPPFAEYVSGHSTFSATAAEILRRVAGSDKFGLFYADPSTGITLYWQTFTAAAHEAGMSRCYGGIHFQDGNWSGQRLGRLVGASAWFKAQTFIQGTARSNFTSEP